MSRKKHNMLRPKHNFSQHIVSCRKALEAALRPEGGCQGGFPCFFRTALKASSAMSHVL